jgi:hypothetical protein
MIKLILVLSILFPPKKGDFLREFYRNLKALPLVEVASKFNHNLTPNEIDLIKDKKCLRVEARGYVLIVEDKPLGESKILNVRVALTQPLNFYKQ